MNSIRKKMHKNSDIKIRNYIIYRGDAGNEQEVTY